MAIDVLTAVVVGAIVVVLFVLFRPQKFTGTPPPKVKGLPLLGSFVQFAKHPLQLIKNSYDTYGDVFTLGLFGQRMTFLIGPEAHAVFFGATDEQLSPKEAYKFVVPVFGRGVVYDSPTEVMYEQLKFIKSGLMVNQLKADVPIMVEEATKYISSWKNEGTVDLLEAMSELIILTASRCLLGPEIYANLQRHAKNAVNPPASEEPSFADLYHQLEGGLNPIGFFFPYLPLPAFRKRDKARLEIVKVFSQIIKKRRESGQRGQDILQILMESQYKDGSTLDDDKITGLLIALLFAGQHTSSITSTWVGLLLHAHPEHLQAVLKEQQDIIAEMGPEINFDALKKMTKLEHCVRETLRLYPPLIMLMRKAKVPLQYKNYVIPEGDILCISPGAAMRVEAAFKDPDVYNPTRFEENLQAHSFVAFGGGRHGCPGENFGILQVKTIWSVMLRHFTFTVDKVPPPDYTTLVVGPSPPCIVKYAKRMTPFK